MPLLSQQDAQTNRTTLTTTIRMKLLHPEMTITQKTKKRKTIKLLILTLIKKPTQTPTLMQNRTKQILTTTRRPKTSLQQATTPETETPNSLNSLRIPLLRIPIFRLTTTHKLPILPPTMAEKPRQLIFQQRLSQKL